MKIYNNIDENGYFTGISTQGGISVPIKPLINEERARLVDGKWEYEFTKVKKNEDSSVYSLFENSISCTYTLNIMPLNGDIVLKKSEEISILIPCYNKAKYIVDCVKSCVNQTMKPKEIIILLMDKESQSLIDELENISDIVTCVVSEKFNAVKARVKLVNEYCNTDWFILLDADDMLCEDFIEVAYNKDGSVVFPRCQWVEENGKLGDFEDTSKFNYIRTSYINNALYGNLTCLINKEIFNEVGLDEELCNGGEDFDFIVRLLALKKYKIAYEYRICYYYRTTDGLSSSNVFYESHYKALLKNLDFLHQEYVAKNDYIEYEDDFYKNPTLETFVKYIPTNRLNVLEKKEKELLYKLYLSKNRTPICTYDYYKFTTLGNAKMNEWAYVGKEFDVIFTEEINHMRIVSDEVNAIINKDILPKIEGMKGLTLIEYLLDNYCCFEERNPPVEIFNNEEELQRLNNVDNEVIQEQLKLVDIPKTSSYKNNLPININFTFHNVCNLKCEYCSSKCRNAKIVTDDEVYENFDKALTYIEEKFKGRALNIGILGGEPTLFSDNLITKITNRLKNYRTYVLFTNDTNRNSIWYDHDNILYLTHIVDWKEHPENICVDNFERNQIPIIVVTSKELDILDEILTNYNVVKDLIINACSDSPIKELDLTKNDIDKLNKIIERRGLFNGAMCRTQGNTILINCENLNLCKKCCKQKEDFPLEEVMTKDRELCKNCIFYDTCMH